MLTILHIRKIPAEGYDGTDNYCQRLHMCLADDEECRVLEVPDIPQKRSVFKYAYDENVLAEYIAKADVIHVNGYTAWGTRQALRLARRMGKKVVYTAHWHPFSKLRHPFLGKMFFTLFLKPYIRRYADAVTTINNEDTAFFRRFHSNVIQIPHWNVNDCKPDTSIVRKPNMIVFVGRINDPVKGFEHILSLPENVYDIHCVGKGDITATRKDITHHVNIPQKDLDRLYAEASLMVVPSKYEAFSFAALEALAMGTPVVMSQNVRIADYLGGIEGYSVFSYGDIDDFNRKVNETIGRHVDTQRIADTFSARRIISLYKNVYKSI